MYRKQYETLSYATQSENKHLRVYFQKKNRVFLIHYSTYKTKRMGKFQKFVPGRVDREAQEKKKLSDIEMLILKPHTKGLKTLTSEELKQYISLNIETLKKTKMNIKTIMIAQETKKFLIEHEQELLDRITERQEKGKRENEGKGGR